MGVESSCTTGRVLHDIPLTIYHRIFHAQCRLAIASKEIMSTFIYPSEPNERQADRGYHEKMIVVNVSKWN